MKASAQPMPHDIEAEYQVLGLCLRDNANIDKASEILGPEDFYDPFFGRIFEMMQSLLADGETVTAPIMALVMKTDPGFAEIKQDPQDVFPSMVSAAPVLTGVVALSKMLRDLSQRREIIRLSEAMAADAAAGIREVPLPDILERFQAAVDGIATSNASAVKHRPVGAADATSDMLRRIEEQATAERPHGVSTGNEFVDRILGGLFPGRLYVAAGRPSMGKSIIGTGVARQAARFIPADYLSGEMDNDELSARTGADIDFDTAPQQRLDPLKYGDFVHLKASAAQFERMALARGVMEELDLRFLYRPGMTLEWIEATCRRRSREKPGHRLVVIDHLQLIEWASAPRGTGSVQVVTQITKRLKALAGELGITILLLCQLSRDVEKRDDKHPQLSDLRESGSIEQDADAVIGIMRPLVYARQKLQASRNEEQRHKAILEYDEAKDVLEIAVLKNRGGRTTEYVKIFIKPEASAIRDAAPDGTEGADLIDWAKLAEDLR